MIILDVSFVFFFNDTATTEIYTLSLHDALPIFELRQHERAADARFHGMEVAELAPADLVHPHPLPRGAHEHHLLGDVLERADALARLLEAPRRARREILARRVGFGTLARAVVQIGGPVARRLMVDGDHSSPIDTRSEEPTSELQSQSALVCR